MSAQQLPCPTCGKLTPVSQAVYLPFCSDRCRLIDLGRWLDEEHAVPAESMDDEDQADPTPLKSTSGADSPIPERAPIRLPPGWHDA